MRCGVAVLVAALAACGGEPVAPPPPPPPTPPPALPVTGDQVPELAAFDRIIPELMTQWKIPGGAVAVSYQGRLVYARGYGWRDTLTNTPVAPDQLFRIASVTKPLTAVAVLKLAQQGKLDLDAPAFSLIPELTAPPGTTQDPRLLTITVKHLLWHTAGWDRDQSGDPVFQNRQIAQTLGLMAPVGARDLVRYMMGRPLDFTPGARSAYSNFGYMVLGRIIETVSGMSYEDCVRSAVLTPAGVTRMRLGRSRLTDRFAEESRYYDRSTAPSVFPGEGNVPFPDGGFYLESMDSHGGWAASTVDLLRFLTAVDGFDTRPDILPQQWLGRMVQQPPAVWAGSSYYYGMGWLVRPDPGNWWHNGSLPGTVSFLARFSNGGAVAALFNAREMVPNPEFESLVDPRLNQALGQVRTWPLHDWFGRFP